MTRMGRRLIEDFLLPSLNDQRYGELLKWVDRDKLQFVIRWSHKNAAKWTLNDTAVFQDWDRLKGHFHPEERNYYMAAKQRFRAALYKLNSVQKLPCDEKHMKKYQLIMDDKRRGMMLGRARNRITKPPKSIPTSVICKNSSYIEKLPKKEYVESMDKSMSPTNSVKSAGSEKEELQKCFKEYTSVQKQRVLNYTNGKPVENAHRITESPMKVPPVLRENSLMQRTSHLPIPPVPVYSGSVKQIFGNQQKLNESPLLLVVQTHEKEPNNVKEEAADCGVESMQVDEPTDCALNLSARSNNTENLSKSYEDGENLSR